MKYLAIGYRWYQFEVRVRISRWPSVTTLDYPCTNELYNDLIQRGYQQYITFL